MNFGQPSIKLFSCVSYGEKRSPRPPPNFELNQAATSLRPDIGNSLEILKPSLISNELPNGRAFRKSNRKNSSTNSFQMPLTSSAIAGVQVSSRSPSTQMGMIDKGRTLSISLSPASQAFGSLSPSRSLTTTPNLSNNSTTIASPRDEASRLCS